MAGSTKILPSPGLAIGGRQAAPPTKDAFQQNSSCELGGSIFRIHVECGEKEWVNQSIVYPSRSPQTGGFPARSPLRTLYVEPSRRPRPILAAFRRLQIDVRSWGNPA
jgi:hypothetical protein